MIPRSIFASIFFLIVMLFPAAMVTHAAAQESTPKLKQDEWRNLSSKINYFSEKNTDSLYQYLLKALELEKTSALKTRQKLFIHDKLGQYYALINHPDSALEASRKAWKLAHETGSKEKIYNHTYRLANAFDRLYNSDSALPYYGSAIQYYRLTKDSIPLAKALSGEASALLEIGYNKTALERLHEAGKILETTDLYFEIGKVYDNIGMINAELGYEEKTNEYCKKAIENYKKLKDSIHLAGAYANFGVSCKNLGQYDTAMYYYRQSNHIARQTGHQWIVAKNLLNMGNLHDIQGNTEQAKAHFLNSLEICHKAGILMGEFLNNINLGELELQEKRHHSAISYFKKAIALGKTYNFDKLEVAYFNLHVALSKAGNYSEALKYLYIYSDYKDSLFKTQKHREIMELQIRYETQKKEAEVIRLKQEKQADKLTKAYLIIALASLAIIAIIVIFWIYRKRSKTRQRALRLEKDNQQKRDQMEKLRLENQLQEEKAERYQLDLEMKEQELVYHTLKQAGITHIYKAIIEKLSPFALRLARKKDQEEFTKTLQNITQDVDHEPLSDFEEMFIQMHGEFYEKLLAMNQELSRSELQLCALLRMNLPSKEIASLLNLATSTIDQRRHSIRKKLGLENHQNLISYLISL